MNSAFTVIACGLVALGAQSAPAQQAVPVRDPAPATVKSTESFGNIFGVRQLAGGKVLVNDGVRRQLVALDKLPDYEPPIAPGSLKADLDGRLWVVPRTSAAAQGGLLYDVVNRLGEITERVQFPNGLALAGFGPGGVIYVTRRDGKAIFLERAKRR